MPRPERYPEGSAVIGLRARKGGAVAVGVRVEHGEPRVVLSSILETGKADDRLSWEPYQLVHEMARGPTGYATNKMTALVAEGRRRQEQHATEGLQAIVQRLEAGAGKPVAMALLINRAGWITDLLDYSQAWAEHVPVAEAPAVRDALRTASRQCGMALAELDEKSLPELAVQVLRHSAAEIDARLKHLGVSVGKPWRKDQRLACLAAWVTIAKQR